MKQEIHSLEKVYHLPRFVEAYLLIFPFLGIVFVGFGLLTFLPFFNDSFADSIGTTLAGIVFLIVMLSIYKSINRSRLVLTENGITCYAWGFRIYTPWQNVIGVSSIQPYTTFPANFRKIWGLQLRQPCVLGMKLVDGKQQGKAVLETDWWNPASTMGAFAGILPLNPMINVRNWKESELGKDIQYYVPGVFVE